MSSRSTFEKGFFIPFHSISTLEERASKRAQELWTKKYDSIHKIPTRYSPTRRILLLLLLLVILRRACILNIFHISFASPRSPNHASSMSKKHHKLYPFIIRAIWNERQQIAKDFFRWLNSRDSQPPCRALHSALYRFGLFSLSRRRANIIADYLHIFMPSFLFAFNYHVMSRGGPVSKRYSNSLVCICIHIGKLLLPRAHQERYRLQFGSYASRKFTFFHFYYLNFFFVKHCKKSTALGLIV